MSPYQKHHGRLPPLTNLHPWGCKVIAKVSKPESKLDPRGDKAHWIGFDTESNGHFIYWPQIPKVSIERNVVFLLILPIEGERDKDFNFDINGPNIDIGPVNSTLRKKIKLSDGTTTPPEIDEDHDPNDSPIYEEFQPKDPNIIEGKRQRQPSQRAKAAAGLDDQWVTHFDCKEAKLEEAMAAIIGSEPRTVPEAKRAPDWLQWKEAMDYRINSLESRNTWTIVDNPNSHKPIEMEDSHRRITSRDINIVGSKWVFRYKHNKTGSVVKHHARLVAQGFTQVDGVDYFADETFASICKLSSIRSILTVAAREDWEIEQLDVKSAYLYSKLSKDEIIYMNPPPHYTLKDICPGQVLRLNSTIYGLKQSGRRWYEVLRAILESFEMIRLETEHAVFYRRESDGSTTILFVHVDDMTLIARNIALMNKIKSQIASRVTVDDNGPLHWLLGIEICRDRQQ